MKFVSITRNFRGFNYKNDWETAEHWRQSMTNQIKENDEVEWSILIDTRGGMPVLKYVRGLKIFSLT